MEKQTTGFTSIDNPQNTNHNFWERHPFIPNGSIYDLIKRINVGNEKQIAIDSLDTLITYKKFLNDSLVVSKALLNLGVKSGDIIAISMPDMYQSLITFLACNRIGVIVTFLRSTMSNGEIYRTLNNFETPILFNYDKTCEENQDILKNTNVKHIVTLNKRDRMNVSLSNNYRITSCENQLNWLYLGSIGQERHLRIEKFHKVNETALLLFTGGSTCSDKIVELSNKNIIADIMYDMNTSKIDYMDLSKTLVCIPFAQSGGLISALSSLIHGRETILAPDIGTATISYYFNKKPSLIFGNPAILDLAINNVGRNFNLSDVKYFISSGDYLSQLDIKHAKKFFSERDCKSVKLENRLITAETGIISTTTNETPDKKKGSGKILVGTKALIIDENRFSESQEITELKYGEVGLLLISGKHVFSRYYGDDELTRESFVTVNKEKYYNTEIVGSIDEEGYFTPFGRQARFYVDSNLNKIYCNYVEEVICKISGIKEVAVVEVKEDKGSYTSKAYIVLEEGINADINAIKELLKLPIINSSGTYQLKEFEIPKYVEIIPFLPRRMNSDKVNYSLLKNKAQEDITNMRFFKKS